MTMQVLFKYTILDVIRQSFPPIYPLLVLVVRCLPLVDVPRLAGLRTTVISRHMPHEASGIQLEIRL